MTNILLSKKTWLILSITTLLVMGGIYIYQVNDLVGNVYTRDQRHQKLVELQEELKRSEVAVSQNQSLTQIDKLIEKGGFKTVDRVEYIQVSDTQVAAIR